MNENYDLGDRALEITPEHNAALVRAEAAEAESAMRHQAVVDIAKGRIAERERAETAEARVAELTRILNLASRNIEDDDEIPF